MTATCAFCDIATHPASVPLVHETEHTVAFLDHRPVFKGHVLVIPRAHIVTLPDLPDEQLASYFREVRAVATAVPRALEAHGTFVAMNNTVSQSVPHLHCHVVPRRRRDGLRGFFWPRTRYSDGEAAGYALRIAAELPDGARD